MHLPENLEKIVEKCAEIYFDKFLSPDVAKAQKMAKEGKNFHAEVIADMSETVLQAIKAVQDRLFEKERKKFKDENNL